MTDSTRTVDLDTTISALQQELTSIPTDQAMTIIDSWQQQLQGTDIAEDLGELKQALSSGNAPAIANILTDLGEDTAASASNAPAEVANKVEQLGRLLEQKGNTLK